MTAPRLFALAPELQGEVLQYCRPKDLLAMCMVSRSIKAVVLPLLYRTVDLSVHNIPGETFVDQGFSVKADYPERHRIEHDAVIFRKQERFAITLIKHPEYGSFVRSLTWTFLDAPCSENLAREREVWEDQAAWRALETLNRVYKIDIAILHSVDASRLDSLELDNVVDFGQVGEGKLIPSNGYLKDYPESFHANGRPRIKHPGPMRGHLRALEQRCTALRHLCLRSVGQHSYTEADWYAPNDEERYCEWASFLRAVQPTLETFIFEQGCEASSLVVSRCQTRLSPPQSERPMDVRFIKYISPVLLNGNWPRLRKISVIGIGGRFGPRVKVSRDESDRAKEINDRVYAPLLSAFHPPVEINIEKDSQRSFFLGARVFDGEEL
ncbi:MAG: hypothetical protein M1817_004533 [Caeruleum heppii]|nr:MAG: hypothetical protein M1817_004533 [Caeruleum heppii]